MESLKRLKTARHHHYKKAVSVVLILIGIRAGAEVVWVRSKDVVRGMRRNETQAEKLARAKRAGASVQINAKQNGGCNKAASDVNMRKLEEDSETFKHDKVNQSLSRAIQQARLEKKMTQKALATAINEKPQIIAEYESGKAIPNAQLISKIERALGTRLPRGGNKKKPTKK